MKRSSIAPVAFFGAGLALTVLGSAYAGAASASDRVNFSISFGVPAPAVVYGPPVVYAPPPVMYAPPQVVYAPPYYGTQVVVTNAPRYAYDYEPRGYVSYGYREHRHWDRGMHRGWR